MPAASLEDAVHDVFMVVHRQRERFEGRSTARTWILGIARRVAHNHRRTQARTRRRHLALAGLTPPVPDPDDDIARQEGWRALQGFLEELDEDKRAAFVLGELERLNRQELGVALGVSPNTAWSRLRAARARFHVRFSADGATQALSAGRHAEPAPAESRQRVWLVLTAGLRDGVVPVASAWSVKAVLTTVGLAGAVLGAVALAAPGRSGGSEPAVKVTRSSSEASDDGGSTTTRSAMAEPATIAPAEAPTPLERSAAPGITPTANATPQPATPSGTPRARLEPTAPRVPRPSTATSDGATADADELAAETSLMLTARAALEDGRPGAALSALDEHRRRFPRGVLAEERDASRIRAHCAAGRHEDARREARELAAAYPRSAYLDALASFCPSSVTNPERGGDSSR